MSFMFGDDGDHVTSRSWHRWGSDPGGGVADVVAGLGVVHRHCCDLQLGGDRVGQLMCLAGGGLDDRGQCPGDSGADVAGDRARLREGSGTGLGDLGDRVVGRGGAILCGPAGNGDENSFEKVTAFPAPEP